MVEVPEHTRLHRLRETLVRYFGPGLVVEPFRSGVDCWVDLVRRDGAPDAVVRTARCERLVTRYEGVVDFGLVLEKEVVAYGLLDRGNVPTPRILAWHRSADPEHEPSWMLAELVPHAPVNEVPVEAQAELGRIARRIHRVALTADERSRLAPPSPWDPWIRERLRLRFEAARRYVTLPPPVRLERAVSEALGERESHARSLLHLDLRAPNLALAGGRILAVFDLANALVGDPYLELARIRGCGLLTPEFIAGYGLDPAELDRHGALLDGYELDLAALLVVVSREEFDDPVLHQRMAERVTELVERVMGGRSP